MKNHKNYKTNNLNIEKLITLYKSEQPVGDICKEFEITKQTLYNILKRENVDLNKSKYNTSMFCPLFDTTSYHDIYCEGECGEFKKVIISFKDKNEKYSYIEKYCNGKGFQKCKIYRIFQELCER